MKGEFARRQRLRRQMAMYRMATEMRNELILEALDAGFQVKQIHDFTGVGTTTIWKIRKQHQLKVLTEAMNDT